MSNTGDFINPDHLQQIQKSLNDLIQSADKNRLEFSKLLLTIYTPVTSGLLLLSISIKYNMFAEKVLFLFIATTAVLIIFSTLIEKFVYYLISKKIAQTYVDYVRETGKHLYEPMYGKQWQNAILKYQPYITIGLLMINLFSALAFIYIKSLLP